MFTEQMITLPISTKSVLATLLLALAVLQLAWISVALGWIGDFSLEARRRASLFHRFEGYVALVVILTIAYDCIFVIRPNLSLISTRAQIHSFLGGSVLVLVFAKIFIARFARSHFDWLPKVGLTLFFAVVAVWISSAAWYFFWYPRSVSSDLESVTQSETVPLTGAALGEQLFQKICTQCHSVNGMGASGPGPDLTHENVQPPGGIDNRQFFDMWLKDPKSYKPDAKMPRYPLTDEEREALVEYLLTLK